MSVNRPKILVVSATTKNNLELAKKLQTELETTQKVHAYLLKLEDHPLPLFTPSLEEEQGIPDEAYLLSETFKTAQAFVMVAPEYNGSIPPIVVNAMTWVSRTGKDWREAFNGKFMVVASHSGGGGAKVAQAMRGQFEHLGGIVLPRVIIVNSSKSYNPEAGASIMGQLVELVAGMYSLK